MEEQNQEQKTHSQHPIPQNVMGVEFKLVGGLTLRQFAFLAGFIIVAWVLYSSNLPNVIKTPGAVTIALLGLFISLVPIQDRSADIWLKNFLLAVSSPTQRVWKKGTANLDIFFELREARDIIKEQKEGVTTRDRRELNQYLRRAQSDELNTLDLAESEFLKGINVLQSDVSVPEGLVSQVVKVSAPPGEAESKVVREEVTVTPTLASEVNYSEEKVIAISTGGKGTKFVTPIQNTRTGRRLRLVRPGEVGLGVAGEKKITVAATVQKAADDLARQVEAVGQKIEKAQARAELIPSTPERLSVPIVESLGSLPPPIPTKPQPAPTTVTPAPEVKPTAPAENLPEVKLARSDEIQARLAQTEAPEAERLAEERRVETGKIAYLSEQLEALRNEKQKLLNDLGKQKEARQEAETYAAMAAEYQKRASEASSENSRLAAEMKKAQEELRRLQDVTLKTNTEKETLAKQIKESERRVSELAREKSQTTDSLINMQRELRELRIKQRFSAPAPPAAKPSGPSVTVVTPQTASAKPLPFINDAPNVINGYVRGRESNLIKNAVIIVKDSEGSPVRALKTNELGQFAITTPVGNGAYTVEASSPGESFGIMSVDVYGTVLEPLDFVGI